MQYFLNDKYQFWARNCLDGVSRLFDISSFVQEFRKNEENMKNAKNVKNTKKTRKHRNIRKTRKNT